MEEKIQLQLSKDETLVLFEFLSRFSETDTLEIVDQAEARVLWDLCCRLESSLSEPFLKTYGSVLQEARDRVRDKD